MPGLAGIFNADGSETDMGQLLNRMCLAMRHESWYKEDTLIGDRLALARIGLGILNPEPQPIFNENKSLCIMMDGEIFDYQDLKQELTAKGHRFLVDNDPEFVLHLYEEHGNDFVYKLNGLFTLAIWNSTKQEILIVNDRYGLRPLYYARHNGALLFASEVKALLQDKTLTRRVNNEAVADFFAFGQLLGDKTFLEGVQLLPPASILTCHKDRFSIEQYWQFIHEEGSLSESYYVEELVRRFRKAVRIRTQDEHRKGLLLSGGLDSRSILAAADGKLDTFTFGDEGSGEARIARAAATALGARNEFFQMKQDYIAKHAERAVYLTDGMLSIVHFHAMSLLESIRGRVDIIFDGLSLDRLLGGNLFGSRMTHPTEHELAAMIFRKKMNSVFTDHAARQLFVREYYQRITHAPFQSLLREVNKTRDSNPANRSDHFLLRNRERRLISMGPSLFRTWLEHRAPTYDNDLVDLILSIPPRLRSNHRVYGKFLKKLQPAAARVPYNKTGVRADAPCIVSRLGYLAYGGKIVSKRLLRRYTRGLVSVPIKSTYPDYDEWMRQNSTFSGFAEEILLDRRTLSRGYFNNDFVRRLIDDHMRYRRDHVMRICALITFELWHRQFLD